MLSRPFRKQFGRGDVIAPLRTGSDACLAVEACRRVARHAWVRQGLAHHRQYAIEHARDALNQRPALSPGHPDGTARPRVPRVTRGTDAGSADARLNRAFDSPQEERAAGVVALLDTRLINHPSHRRDQP